MNVRNIKQKTRVACFQAYTSGSEPANRAKAKQSKYKPKLKSQAEKMFSSK